MEVASFYETWVDFNRLYGVISQKLKWGRIYKRHGDFISLFFRLKAGKYAKNDVKEMGVDWIHLAQERVQW
jgi:hypothetical protein